jgi:YidC/Oxa1 family membrane protein insertase
MDKKVFLAVSLCAGIFLLWQNVYLKPLSEKQRAWSQQQAVQSGAHQTETPAPAPAKSESSGSERTTQLKQGAAGSKISEPTIELGNTDYRVVVAKKGGTVREVMIPNYKGQTTERLAALIGGQEQLELNTPSPEWQYLSQLPYTVKARDKDESGHERLTLSYDDSNVSVLRTYVVRPEVYSTDADIDLKFKKQAPSYMFVDLRTARHVSKEVSENERRQVFLNKSGGQSTWMVEKIDSVEEDLGQGNWFGFSSRYFLNAVADRASTPRPQFQARPLENGEIAASFFYRVQGESVRVPVRFYFGPKDLDILKAAGHRLETAVDFGWFTFFAYPMLKALKWFYGFLHNFGLAIILLTVLVKVLTYPLTLKSMKSMKEMQRIQPQIARLRERYKDDKERLNREMLQLMRANGYNPMSGCLPMFIQMPIFIALYNVLYGAIDLYGQPFFGWIHDLSAKDPFYVTPILLALMMFLQQKMTPNTAADPAQQRMMTLMPVIFGFMMLWLPSGLTLYMLVNSVVSVLQQILINRTIGGRAPAPAA